MRPVAGYGLPEFLRVTVGLPAENRRFLDALAAVCRSRADRSPHALRPSRHRRRPDRRLVRAGAQVRPVASQPSSASAVAARTSTRRSRAASSIAPSPWTRTGRARSARADLVLVATPVGEFAALFRALAAAFAQAAIVTDAGSTKESVIAAARAHLGDAVRAIRARSSDRRHRGERRNRRVSQRSSVDRNVVLTPPRETMTATRSRRWRACGRRAARSARARSRRPRPHLRRGFAPASRARVRARRSTCRATRRRRRVPVRGERISRFHAHRGELARNVARHLARQPRRARRGDRRVPSAARRGGSARRRSPMPPGSRRCSRARQRRGASGARRSRGGGRRRRRSARALAWRRRCRTPKPAPGVLDLAPRRARPEWSRLPGSKSISNRTLLLAALARGDTRLSRSARRGRRRSNARCALGARDRRRGDRAARDFAVEGQGGHIPVNVAKLALSATPAPRFGR